MLIRDDRGKGKKSPPFMSPQRYLAFGHGENARHFRPDHVLADCAGCGRAHFVTVGGCPAEAESEDDVMFADLNRIQPLAA